MSNETRRTYQLGEFDGTEYLLTVRASPDERNVEDFAVTVHYNDSTEDRGVNVVRIDNAHGSVHIDKLYRRGQPKEAVDMTPWEAEAHLVENWRRFAREHAKAHGE